MAIIPTVRCRSMRAARACHTGVRDLTRIGDDVDDPDGGTLRLVAGRTTGA